MPSPRTLLLPSLASLAAGAQEYYGECWDALDEAHKIDPEGEKDPVVQEARAAIAADHAADVYFRFRTYDVSLDANWSAFHLEWKGEALSPVTGSMLTVRTRYDVLLASRTTDRRIAR